MLRTPKLHFDFVRGQIPEIEEFHRMMMREHESLTDDELRHGLLSPLAQQIVGSPKYMSYQMMLYDRFGQNSYVVGPRVQDLFRRTDLSKITPDMVVDPQTSFYIALPDCPWKIWGGDRTQWHNLQGIYVGFVDSVDSGHAAPRDLSTISLKKLMDEREKCIQILLWGGANERSLAPTDDAMLWFAINLDKWVREGEDIETFFRQNAVMTADRKNDGQWDGELDPLDPFAAPLMPGDPADVTTQRETIVNAVRLILNLCLYMGSDDPEFETVDNKDEVEKIKKQIERKKTGGKRKKLERRLANLPRTKMVYVGPLFEQLDKKTREQNRSSGGTHATPIEHAVPPHWQHYWVGSAEDRRKILRHKGMYRRGTGKPDRTIVKIRE